jgi:hypothetical protein
MKARRAIPLGYRERHPRFDRFVVWYGYGQPGFSGGFVTGCFFAVIIWALCVLIFTIAGVSWPI